MHALQAASVDRGQRRAKAARCLALMKNRAQGQAFRSWAAYAAHVKVGSSIIKDVTVIFANNHI